ncbi:MAG: homocysteine S-methyltransferase family protein [Pseudomonadota bacterium]|jgi:homocysteine S-methyltransferase|nr:homocysteine S-methyltransferase family protein [Gammaproteobacteria bacterium]MDC1097246.1 homocysteine S-methyltransferase family protein [Gammaproteobacteria bacterium]
METPAWLRLKMIDSDWVVSRLKGEGRPIILDGGMGTALERNGVPMDDRVWSGRAMLTHPDAVRSAHEAFIQAGAEAILTNTFSTARHMLEPGGLGSEVRKINSLAVDLAKQARERVARSPVAIVGSICEWTSDLNPTWCSPEVVGQAAREQAEVLAESGVDILALEMCERVELSEAVTDAIIGLGLPVWMGVSARTHQGQTELATASYADCSFEEIVKRISSYPVDIVNIMHTQIPDVDRAFEIVRRYWSGPIGIYPESGFFTMPNWNFVDVISPEDLVAEANTWVKNGVRLLGGCCGLGPDHIKALANMDYE